MLEVGVVTRDVASIDDLSNRLAPLLGLDAADVADRLRRAPSDEVSPVVARRQAELDPLRTDLSALPGVVLTDSTATLTPNDSYGRALLGWAGEVTAEILERFPRLLRRR